MQDVALQEIYFICMGATSGDIRNFSVFSSVQGDSLCDVYQTNANISTYNMSLLFSYELIE